MSNTREHDSQRTPIPNASPAIADLVCADIQRRKEHGIRKYGVALQANNGRNALQDAYEEALDLCHYLKQRIQEEGGLISEGALAQLLMQLYESAPDSGCWRSIAHRLLGSFRITAKGGV